MKDETYDKLRLWWAKIAIALSTIVFWVVLIGFGVWLLKGSVVILAGGGNPSLWISLPILFGGYLFTVFCFIVLTAVIRRIIYKMELKMAKKRRKKMCQEEGTNFQPDIELEC